jgi:hypothetical protein
MPQLVAVAHDDFLSDNIVNGRIRTKNVMKDVRAHMNRHVEGREVAAVTFSGTIGSSMVPLTLGARQATTMVDEALLGRLDDVRLFARALTSAEIAALAAP